MSLVVGWLCDWVAKRKIGHGVELFVGSLRHRSEGRSLIGDCKTQCVLSVAVSASENRDCSRLCGSEQFEARLSVFHKRTLHHSLHRDDGLAEHD